MPASLYTEELLAAICDRLSQGEPLAQICRDPGMPHANTVRDWMEAHLFASVAIARARENGFDVIAADALNISDDSRNDYIEALAEQGDAKAIAARENGESVQRARLRVDTRLKLLAKWDPKRYGDKVQHADADGNKLPTDINLRLVDVSR